MALQLTNPSLGHCAEVTLILKVIFGPLFSTECSGERKFDKCKQYLCIGFSRECSQCSIQNNNLTYASSKYPVSAADSTTKLSTLPLP